ncbi:olfactory receptor 1020-like [Tachyglossus aculeatus]|uniref:olfactory receptor 1020-like n=1 Tax=Tachyglossus aculeatus TaxID=9261 RepID=UPI0018F28E16|nr:olfactory receptor 1020-like [Tachyglossus aculeatus]
MVAICNPLLYETVISWKVCVGLVAGSYLAGFANATLLISSTSQFTFCGSNMIHHYFCNALPLLQLSCSDTCINEILLSAGVGLIQISMVMTLLYSYLHILIFILKIPSPEGRRKAFFTCSSHLIAVVIFYGTIYLIYLRPDTSSSLYEDLTLLIFYTMMIPMLNFLIYSMRNREVKVALRNAMERRVPCRRPCNSIALATTECFLLAAMTFDHFVIICNPLLYTVSMSNRVSSELAIAVYIYGFLNSLIQNTMILQASFCDSSPINHFYLADPPLSLSCSDTQVKKKQIFIISILNPVSSLLVVFLSYCCIFIVVLKFPSGEERCKAFSTCVTLLTIIALYYGTLFSVYFQQLYTNHTLPYDKAASVFYGHIVPMLNPDL